ncbi:MAG: hypothetical protein LBR92_02955 [Puniceicoccales bacterium]|nr:hypothetical protein [Puniceicoccales bacterium]
MNGNLKNKVIVCCIAGSLGFSLFATASSEALEKEEEKVPREKKDAESQVETIDHINTIVQHIIQKIGMNPNTLVLLKTFVGGDILKAEQWTEFRDSCKSQCASLVEFASEVKEAIINSNIERLAAALDQNIGEKWRKAEQTKNKVKIKQAKEEFNLNSFAKVYKNIYAADGDFSLLEQAVRLGNVDIVALLLYYNILPRNEDKFKDDMEELKAIAFQNRNDAMGEFLNGYLFASKANVKISQNIDRGPAYLDKDARGKSLNPQRRNIDFARMMVQALSNAPAQGLYI